jgi:uncharacterized protein YnzC (UPF0291/DUF896 family)
MKFRLIIFSIFLTSNVFAQDYIEYHRIINRIDEDILNKDYSIAINRLDSIYENFDFIYSRHCFKALQICCVSQDSLNAAKWLEKSFIQGVPIWMTRTNELTKQALKYTTTQSTIERYDSLRTIYTNSINLEIRNIIDSLYVIDQEYTTKVNDGFILFRDTYHGIRWLKNNKKQFTILNEMIEAYGYPDERLIGLPRNLEDSIQQIKHFNFWGPSLLESKTYIMLIHYYSNPRAEINNKLLKNIKLGYMPPYQYGALNDFMARWGKKKYGEFQYYNVWHQDPDHSNDLDIESRRKSIGLNSYEQQNRNMLIYRERRKNHSANSEIILE